MMPGTDQRDVTAHHEAAHAVVLYRTMGSAGGPATIVPNRAHGLLGSSINVVGDSFSEDHVRAELLSAYAGGHSDRRLGFDSASQCEADEEIAGDLARRWGWEARAEELREESRMLVERHWAEIVAVAAELLRLETLDDVEIETIADIAGGVPDASLEDLRRYRLLKGGA